MRACCLPDTGLYFGTSTLPTSSKQIYTLVTLTPGFTGVTDVGGQYLFEAGSFHGKRGSKVSFNGMGVEISIDSTETSSDHPLNDAAALFGESASRIVVSTGADNVTRVLELAAAAKVPARVIGQTGGNRLRFSTGGRLTIDMATDDAERAWSAAIESYFAKKIA